MGVPHSHDDRRVPKERLHNIQRDTLHGEVRSERVTKDVPCNSSQICPLAQGIKVIRERVVVERLAVRANEHVPCRVALSIQDLVEIRIKRNRAYAIVLWWTYRLITIAVGVFHYYHPIAPVDR